MLATRSALNAVKHGLTSRTFVPEHARGLVEDVRQDLISIHEPQTGDEMNLIGELSVAIWQNYEHDRLFYERQAFEETVAAIVYDRQAEETFDEQLAALTANAERAHFRFSRSYLGALHLKRILKKAIETLSDNLPLSFEQITDCINATGNQWRLDTCSTEGKTLMGLHLALLDHPETEMEHWVSQSRPLSPERADLVARHQYASAPAAETARRRLLERLGEELQVVMAQLEELHQRDELCRDHFKTANSGYGLGDPASMRAAALALRYRVAAFNRKCRLYKELDKLKNARPEPAMPAHYTYRLPAAPAPDPLPVKQVQHPAKKEVVESAATAPGPVRPAPGRPLRNETAPTPTQPATMPLMPTPACSIGLNHTRRPFENRRARRARMAKQVK